MDKSMIDLDTKTEDTVIKQDPTKMPLKVLTEEHITSTNNALYMLQNLTRSPVEERNLKLEALRTAYNVAPDRLKERGFDLDKVREILETEFARRQKIKQGKLIRKKGDPFQKHS